MSAFHAPLTLQNDRKTSPVLPGNVAPFGRSGGKGGSVAPSPLWLGSLKVTPTSA